ncbi:alanine racemase [Sphingobacterium daejeonense]|uniref:alanine racemase n=1 Tax=Sphingobacterium daejeonense TaxID=371142 RepID=UPI0021A492C4|nr:alanine racemase [Sphingobacterium daejeonense]MCT1530127.1 alanine racemase [Sphingobacterium daejeonense]
MERINKEYYFVKDPSKIPSPSLLLYPEIVKQNITKIIAQIKSTDNLRPHIKTIKSEELIQLLVDAGINKFKCATINEANILGEMRISDILVAYPLVGWQVEQFVQLILKYPNSYFQCLVESIEAARLLNFHAKKNDISIPVFIDINLGMSRTGIGLTKIEDFLEDLEKFENITFVGFHGYDGHIREIDLEIRSKIVRNKFEQFLLVKNKIEEKLSKKLVCVFGGSNTFPIYAEYPFVECSPGTFMLWDWGYHQNLPEQHYEFASILFSRVISKPSNNTICLDLGYKAVASENPLESRFIIIDHLNWKPIFQSEEHLVLEVPINEWNDIKIGDIKYIIPYHICPTVAWYPYYQVIINYEISQTWKIFPRF